MILMINFTPTIARLAFFVAQQFFFELHQAFVVSLSPHLLAQLLTSRVLLLPDLALAIPHVSFGPVDSFR
jgi:hypothetical protein